MRHVRRVRARHRDGAPTSEAASTADVLGPGMLHTFTVIRQNHAELFKVELP